LRGDCRLVFHCHSYLRQPYAAALAGISLAASRATVIASCRFVAEPLRPFIASNQIEVVYNGVGSVAAPIDRDWPRGRTTRLRIGMIGRIGPEKGQLEFVKAARILKSNYEFVVCGAPLFSDATSIRYLEQVRGFAAGLPIEFPGWCEDVHPVLSTLDLLVVPSGPGEATTRVILEAYAAGVPVVASNSGGIPEIVSDGETGFLAPPGDPAKLAARIAEVSKAPAELKRIAENAQHVWRERYTLVRYQGQIISALERIGSQAPR